MIESLFIRVSLECFSYIEIKARASAFFTCIIERSSIHLPVTRRWKFNTRFWEGADVVQCQSVLHNKCDWRLQKSSYHQSQNQVLELPNSLPCDSVFRFVLSMITTRKLSLGLNSYNMKFQSQRTKLGQGNGLFTSVCKCCHIT